MTLSPVYSTSHIFKSSVAKSVNGASHKVQLYLDYDCPFSAKLFRKLYDEVIPAIDSKHPGKFEFIFMNVPQPWHPTSILMHEVALQIGKSYPQYFWDFSKVLFENQASYFDTVTYNKTRLETYKDLIELAAKHFPDISKEEILKSVEIAPSETPSNAGNKIAKDLKYFIRYQRTVGVHVTPTVAVDGIVNGSIESSNEPSDIVEKLESYL